MTDFNLAAMSDINFDFIENNIHEDFSGTGDTPRHDFIKARIPSANLTCYLLSKLSPQNYSNVCPFTTNLLPSISITTICHIEYASLLDKTLDITSGIFKKMEREIYNAPSSSHPQNCFQTYFKMEYGRKTCHIDYSSLQNEDLAISAASIIENNDTYCSYDADKCNHTIFQMQNDLLAKCDKVQCTGKYFKCPNSYCIPMRHECNGLWNCPGGQDERKCANRTCSARFKCHNSSICIAQESICDGVFDCIFHDDDTFCRLPVCPINCTCLLYSISCRNVTLKRLQPTG